MGRIFVVALDGQIYSCRHCNTHLGIADHILSTDFQCRRGTAYLFDKVVNVTVGNKEERMMLTGMYTVVDIFCVGCGSSVGWKYEAAQSTSQKYKEGKFILEIEQVFCPDEYDYPLPQDPQLLSDTEYTDDG